MKSPYSRAGRMLRSSKFHYAAVCKKKSLTKSFDSVKDEYTIRGATLIHDLTRALSEIPSYLRLVTLAQTSQNTLIAHFTAPSAVHLTICFAPGSQHPGFSVRASLPLSPLQRFKLLNLKKEYHTFFFKSTIFFKELYFFSEHIFFRICCRDYSLNDNVFLNASCNGY